MMLPTLKGLLKLPTARLSRRVVFVVFSSIVAIECIILIPSVIRRKNEFISQIIEVSSGKVDVIMQITGQQSSDRELLDRIEKLNHKPTNLIGKLQHKIVGGTLYKSSGELVGTFGEPPTLAFEQVNRAGIKKLRDNSRYDAAILADWLTKDYTLIIRHDISSVYPELIAFILRIAGLVLIISIFTTAGVWISLDPLVITPIVLLRKDLNQAGETLCNDEETPEFYSASVKRKDELGDVIVAFNQMFHKISEAISQRKQAEVALKTSLVQVEAYSQALNKELEKGREIQKNFLPPTILQKQGWEIAAFFQPARQVAGDFYDVFELPNKSVALVIADVCDKGVGAALFMALFRSLIRIFACQNQIRGRASVILEEYKPINGWVQDSASINLAHLNALKAVLLTNNYVAEFHGDLGMFATLFLGILDPDSGLLSYINGGHEPLFILNSSGGVKETLKSTGPAVGMLPDLKFKICQTYLEPGELLVGYTDGVPEARAADGSFFTAKKLLSMLEEKPDSATDLLDDISASVLAHTGDAEQFDDITMLAVRRCV